MSNNIEKQTENKQEEPLSVIRTSVLSETDLDQIKAVVGVMDAVFCAQTNNKPLAKKMIDLMAYLLYREEALKDRKIIMKTLKITYANISSKLKILIDNGYLIKDPNNPKDVRFSPHWEYISNAIKQGIGNIYLSLNFKIE